MTAVLSIDGVDVETTLGMNVTDLGAYLDGAVPVFAEVEISGMPGVIVGGPGKTKARVFNVKGYLDGASQSAVRTNLIKLKALCGDPSRLVPIITGDRPDKVIYARCTEFPALNYPTNSRANSLNEIPCAIELPFRAPFPYWFDTSDASVSFTTSPVAIPQGDAPYDPVLITNTTAAGADTLTCKDYAGNTLWTTVLAARSTGQRYRITLARSPHKGSALSATMTLERYSSGVWSPADNLRTGGIFPRCLEVSGPDYIASHWCTLESTTGSWTASGPKNWK